MVEITILLDIREQAEYLGQEDMVFGDFKPSLQNYKIGNFCVISVYFWVNFPKIQKRRPILFYVVNVIGKLFGLKMQDLG